MNLGQFLTENLLTLLVFDDDRSKIIRNTLEPSLYSGVYKEIAERSYNYIDKYKKAPKEHIADLFEDQLTSKDKRKKRTYEDILGSLYEAKDGINAEFTMSQLETFIKRQSLRSIAVDLTKALSKDTEESLEEAEALMRQASSQRLQLFDPGLRLSDVDRALRFLDLAEECWPTGIPEFDRLNFGLTRKELLLYVADTKTGKTWFMTHLAKVALLTQAKVLHVTLEMSEDKISQRYAQAFFAISKRTEKFIVNKFSDPKEKKRRKRKKELDSNISLYPIPVTANLTFDDPKIAKKLRERFNKWKNRAFKNIIVKQFPTSKLTLNELEAYLDNLAVTENFVPDIMIVDYPDLMALPASSQLRHSLSAIYKGLRGIGVERNFAVAAPTQANREGSGKKFMGKTNVSEAYSKIADADVVMTYSQTEAEKELGLARLSIVAGRNDVDNITVVISQNYNMGQYVVDSHIMNKSYWNNLEGDEDDPMNLTDEDE